MPKTLLSRTEFATMIEANPSTVTRLCAKRLKAACVDKRIDVNHPDVQAYLDKRAADLAPPTGVDPLYAEAVEACRQVGRWSASRICEALKVGHGRAKPMLEMMQATGIAPEPKAKPANRPAPPPEPAPVHSDFSRRRQEAKKKAPVSERPGRPIPEHVEAFLDWTVAEIFETFGSEIQFLDYLRAVKSMEDVAEKRIKNAVARGDLIKRDLVKVGVFDVFNSAHLRMMTDGAKSIAAGTASKLAAGADLQEVENYISDVLGSYLRPIKTKVSRALNL